jgi:maltooligosyltrehalose trehalohydrolase
VHFRVWADSNDRVDGVPCERAYGLEPEGQGLTSRLIEDAQVGQRHSFRRSGMESALPDPAARIQSEGPFGPSEIVDPNRFVWSDGNWRTPNEEAWEKGHAEAED